MLDEHLGHAGKILPFRSLMSRITCPWKTRYVPLLGTCSSVFDTAKQYSPDILRSVQFCSTLPLITNAALRWDEKVDPRSRMALS
jgi:hypothetical protein